MPSVTTQPKETDVSDTKSSPPGYSVVSPSEDTNENNRQNGETDDIELMVIGNLSDYQPVDVDILLESMKVSLLHFLFELVCERSPILLIWFLLLFYIRIHVHRKSLFGVSFLFFIYQVSQAMSNNYLKVSLTQTLREALKHMRDGQQNCVLVVDVEDSLEGILTDGDIKRCLSMRSVDASNSDYTDVCFYLFLEYCTDT